MWIDRVKGLHLWIVAVVCAAAFFAHNQMHPVDIIESRNVVTAREMVQDGHWMVPTMNGELRLEKPPLPTWLTAAGEKLCPGSLAMSRAVAGAGAVLLVFFFYRMGRDLAGRDFALVSTMILCTSYPIILMGRTATWDIWCHAFMLGGIYALWRLLQNPAILWKTACWAGVLFGLSFLSKGPVSFYALLLPFLVAWGCCFRSSVCGKGRALALVLLLCLLVGCWWYAFLYGFHGDELARVLEKESGAWTNRNVRPWYYYATFFQESGVWAVMVLTSLAVKFWMKRVTDRRAFCFVWIWMVAVVVLLSLLPEKKNRYLLPMLIPAAYTVGFLFETWRLLFSRGTSGKADRLLFRLNTGLLALVVAVLPAELYVFALQAGYLSVGSWLFWSLLCWLVTAWLVRSAIRLSACGVWGGIVVLFLAVEIGLLPVVGRMIGNPDFHGLSSLAVRPEAKDRPFYYNMAEPLRIEMVYEAGRSIRPLALDNEKEVERALPLVLLTHGAVERELSPNVLELVDTLFLGQYDNNRRPGRFHRDDFIYNATLLTLKKK